MPKKQPLYPHVPKSRMVKPSPLQKEPETRIIEDVYVATEMKGKVVLQNRNYGVLAEIPTSYFLLHGVIVVQKQENWISEDYNPAGLPSVSYWFGLDSTNKRAVAELYKENGTYQVIMQQPGLGRYQDLT